MVDYFPRKVTHSFFHKISIDKFGVYAVSITARCQGKSFFRLKKEQNLRVEINKIQFREIPPKKNTQLWKIPPTWNGTELKGLSKTIIFILPLNVEDYTFHFLAETEAIIEKFDYRLVSDLRYISFDLNSQAENGDRRPTVKDPEWTKDFADDTDAMLLARLILGEAENQSKEAKIWVGGTVLNRVKAKAKAWPDNIHDVILQKGQYDPFKVSDRNFNKIVHPLNTNAKSSIESWYDSYDIAQKLISGEIANPTTATHFHGIGVTRDWFIENLVPQGKFLKQIDDTYFYWSPN